MRKIAKLFTILLMILHLVFGVSFVVQPVEAQTNTKFILDDATGGDCTSIGNWDSTTKTCILTHDLTEAIWIYSNSVTLDGKGHTIEGNGHGIGVNVPEKSGVTIKNLNVKKFNIGIFLDSSSGNTITGNTANENKKYGIFLYSSSGNTITDNITNKNNWYGIYLDYSSNNNIITSNTANSNKNFGIYVHTSSNNKLTGNIANLNRQYGIYLFASSNNNVLTNNVVSGNTYGIYLFTSTINDLMFNVISENRNVGIILQSSNDNRVYNNNFINNPTQALVRSSSGNFFSLSAPIGGNYWSNYDTAAKGCNDANRDGFCDDFFILRGEQDSLPWHRDGWFRL